MDPDLITVDRLAKRMRRADKAASDATMNPVPDSARAVCPPNAKRPVVKPPTIEERAAHALHLVQSIDTAVRSGRTDSNAIWGILAQVDSAVLTLSRIDGHYRKTYDRRTRRKSSPQFSYVPAWDPPPG